jgi:hypothetical protein
VAPSTENPLKSGDLVNLAELKGLLTIANGKILSTPELVVEYKSEYQGHLGKLALQFESPAGPITNLSVMVA